ncbi:MAG: TetR/AcrR family transcriptional regulator [Oligoflexales bacterium]|nr:TetR/AcrR family transcriptional regulator [Oligoflexales bacterium]
MKAVEHKQGEKQEKEEKILAAATKIFARYGARKATINDIAREARIGKGTIYLYFNSKEEIFARVVRKEGDLLLMRIRSAVDCEKTSHDQLSRFLITRLRFVEDLIRDHGTTLEIFRETKLQPEMELLRNEYLHKEAELVARILDEGVAKGEFFIREKQLTALAISSAFQGLEMPWIWQGRDIKIEDKVSVLMDLFVNGIGRRIS